MTETLPHALELPVTDSEVQELLDGLDGLPAGRWVAASNEDDAFDYDVLHITTDDRCYRSLIPIAKVDISYNEPIETEQQRSAAHIARCHPEFIRRLIATLRSKEERLKEVENALADSIEQLDAIIDDGIPTDFNMWRADLRTALQGEGK